MLVLCNWLIFYFGTPIMIILLWQPALLPLGLSINAITFELDLLSMW
jgi:hypothetical protein